MLFLGFTALICSGVCVYFAKMGWSMHGVDHNAPSSLVARAIDYGTKASSPNLLGDPSLITSPTSAIVPACSAYSSPPARSA